MDNMDKEFIELLEKVIPHGTGTDRAYNADKKISFEDKKKLSQIGRADYDTSCSIMRELIQKITCDGRVEVMPMLYRKAIFFITYMLYHKEKMDGVQSKVLKDLGLAHNSFTKWGMTPIRDYEEGYDWGADIALKREGKKNKELLFLFDGIVSRVKYKKFVDLFGGLGTVTASRPIRKCEKGYINDFDKSIANLLATIKYKPKELEELCRQIVKELELKTDEAIFDYGCELFNKRLEKQYERSDRAVEFDKYEEYDKIDKTIEKLENLSQAEREKLKYAMGLYKKYEKQVREYSNSKTEEERKSGFIVDEDKVDINNALACYYIYSFCYKYKLSISGVQLKSLKAFEDNISNISEYSKRFKKVQVSCCDFKVILENEEINTEDTLLYSDSPYYRTKQYNEGFSDEQHIALHNGLANFKGKWVLSCRQKITNNNKYKDKKDGEEKIRSLLEYFEMYADIAKYVVYANDDNKIYEIMITNFDFKVPNNETFNLHLTTLDESKNYKGKLEIDGERGYTKETYDEFLTRIRESMKE
ncbi:MAG: hypothetical protein ACLUC0_07855 [Clostridium neonatale]|uniref:hypothetical protein n=1 Tax=Clostridium neonatale TaxID=137838 RepID=UPI00291C463F|nr:DNA adenine methylase [Clostridium neonatale]